MSHIVVISVVAAAIGLCAAIRGPQRYVVVGGAILVCIAIAALVWSRPSTAKFEQQEQEYSERVSRPEEPPRAVTLQ